MYSESSCWVNVTKVLKSHISGFKCQLPLGAGVQGGGRDIGLDSLPWKMGIKHTSLSCSYVAAIKRDNMERVVSVPIYIKNSINGSYDHCCCELFASSYILLVTEMIWGFGAPEGTSGCHCNISNLTPCWGDNDRGSWLSYIILCNITEPVSTPL